MTDTNNNACQNPAREKFLALSLKSTRKSYYPQLLKNLEKARENEQHLQLLIDNMPAQISYIDSTERYVLVNREFSKTFRRSKDQIVGKRIETILGKKSYDRVKIHIDRALAGQSGQFEFSIKQPPETTRWYETSYIAETDSKGKINGFYTMTIDLTEKKLAEKERAQLKDRLRQAQKMEAIGTLSGGIAHDFNNILSGIFGYLELADTHITDPMQTRMYLKKTFESAKRASKLIEQILTFSRQAEYVKKPLALSGVLNEALALLRSSLPSNIKIKKSIHTDAPILADSTQIHQITMNLCTNAYHAMAKDGGTLTVELNEVSLEEGQIPEKKETTGGRYVEFIIRDTGSGIDPAIIEKIFDPYFTTKNVGKGTGLGLAIVRGIVKKHNGFIRVESVPGSGTCFRIYFPVFHSSQEKQDRPDKNHETGFTGSENIMLVDDEPAILETLKALLSRKGYRISTFENGESALKAFSGAPDSFDLVVSDMTMPGMTGDRLAKELLKIKNHIPIIICTGFHEGLSEKDAINAGIKKLVQKPVSGKELSEIIRGLLDAGTE